MLLSYRSIVFHLFYLSLTKNIDQFMFYTFEHSIYTNKILTDIIPNKGQYQTLYTSNQYIISVYQSLYILLQYLLKKYKHLFSIKKTIKRMEQQAKLISAQTLDGHKLQFVIFMNSQLGKGAYGTVKKAIDNSKPYEELVAKIIPYGDEATKQKINKQIGIIKMLPDHPNIVKVIPLKCFSEKNFYIFMECCKDGTLDDQMKKKGRYSENQTFNVFYQLMSGYRVLWEKKILHQDIKPENVLIKKNVYKLTDFGFSILYEGFKHSKTRQGTILYMPLEKLTRKQYFASTKSDVFAFGVIMFKIMTGYHPYVNNKFSDYREYITKLRDNPIYIRSHITSKFTIEMQHLFDLVLKMVAKKESDRIDFDQIYQFIEEQAYFAKFHHDKESKPVSQIIQVEYKRFNIVEQSHPVVIPFDVSHTQEIEYGSKVQQNIRDTEAQKKLEICQKLEKYLISRRLIVYFFDRLSRKLTVEKMKKEIQQNGSEEKVILSLLCLEKKITQASLKQYRHPSIYPLIEWNTYKATNPQIVKALKSDQSHIQDLIVQALSESHQIKIKEKRNIIDKAKEPLESLMKEVKVCLVDLLTARKSMISINNRKSLTTLTYILSSIDIVDNFASWMEKGEELESYFRSVETKDTDELLDVIVSSFSKIGEQFSIDLGEPQQENLL